MMGFEVKRRPWTPWFAAVVAVGGFASVALAGGDYNGDGYDDLVVGVSDEDLGPNDVDAGVVHVLYGGPNGPKSRRSDYWHQDVQGIARSTQGDDDFGDEVADGDFNGDGFDDLVIGVEDEDFDAIQNGGLIHVLYGSASGLQAQGSTFFHQDVAGVPDAVEEDDSFGDEVAVGDFDGDGFDDVAVSAIGESIDGVDEAGAVTVLYGSPLGLRTNRAQVWHQNSPGIRDSCEEGDEFGDHCLAAGDFNGDGADDLAISVAEEWVGDVDDAGAVAIIYGEVGTGLVSAGNQLFHQNSSGIADSAEVNDNFGNFLAAGDFDGDGFDDLAVTTEAEEIDGVPGAGSVHVIYGTANGLRGAGSQFWHEGVGGVPGDPFDFDGFGDESLVAGDFNRDGFAELVIGVGADDDLAVDAGVIVLLIGSADGLTATGALLVHQDIAGLNEAAEAGDAFGAAVAVGDFDGDNRDDLVIGVPNEDIPAANDAGIVHFLRGSAQGLKTTNTKQYSQESPGVETDAEDFDEFGSALG
jgi:hypothetical protein